MTPTPAFLLLLAVLWTLPACAAVLTYRWHRRSVQRVKRLTKRTLRTALTRRKLQPQVDA